VTKPPIIYIEGYDELENDENVNESGGKEVSLASLTATTIVHFAMNECISHHHY